MPHYIIDRRYFFPFSKASPGWLGAFALGAQWQGYLVPQKVRVEISLPAINRYNRHVVLFMDSIRAFASQPLVYL